MQNREIKHCESSSLRPNMIPWNISGFTYVCGLFSGVADQLQTNYAADLRHILKGVFECNASDTSQDEVSINSDKSSTDTFVHIHGPESPNDSISSGDNNTGEGHREGEQHQPSPSREGIASLFYRRLFLGIFFFFGFYFEHCLTLKKTLYNTLRVILLPQKNK